MTGEQVSIKGNMTHALVCKVAFLAGRNSFLLAPYSPFPALEDRTWALLCAGGLHPSESALSDMGPPQLSCIYAA